MTYELADLAQMNPQALLAALDRDVSNAFPEAKRRALAADIVAAEGHLDSKVVARAKQVCGLSQAVVRDNGADPTSVLRGWATGRLANRPK